MRVHLEPANADDVLPLVCAQDGGKRPPRRGVWGWLLVFAIDRKGRGGSIAHGGVYVSRWRGRLIATLTLSKRKPWAIDRGYFSASKLPLYITGMAVDPRYQWTGGGRQCIDEARRIALGQDADAICLDAYDCQAGAGPFYAKCGFREVGRKVYRVAPLIYYEMVL